MSATALFASFGQILAGAVFFWLAWRRQLGFPYLLFGSASVLGGEAWFLPSEWAQAAVAVAAGLVMMIAAILLGITTWRQASLHERPVSDGGAK